MNRVIQITAPSRLHFGLLRFAQTTGPSFGGLGMMLDQPATIVEIRQAEHWKATGPRAERALVFAKQAARSCSESSDSVFSIQILQAPPTHSGLGSGTQLAMAIAQGISLLSNYPPSEASSLARSAGRGQRSAIGCHGFLHGGLLWEEGRFHNESLAKLSRRLDVPEQWRVLLITPPQDAGLHGSAEIDAFAELPSVHPETTEQLQHLAEAEILPATEQADFATFSESIYQYGRLAGNCFAPVQGGNYATPQIAGNIEKLLALGLRGVGQSSWGPTIFAFVHNESASLQWLDSLSTLPEFCDHTLLITAPNNVGARVLQLDG